MRLALVLTLSVMSFVCHVEGLQAESLSADTIFGEAGPLAASPDSQSAENKLDRARKIWAENEKSGDPKKQLGNWKDDPTPSLAGTGFKMLQALGLCIGVFLIGLHFYKKYNPQAIARPATRRMRVVERIQVAAKTSLVMLEVDGRKVLLSVGADRVSHVPHESQDENSPQFEGSLEYLCQEDAATTSV